MKKMLLLLLLETMKAPPHCLQTKLQVGPALFTCISGVFQCPWSSWSGLAREERTAASEGSEVGSCEHRTVMIHHVHQAVTTDLWTQVIIRLVRSCGGKITLCELIHWYKHYGYMRLFNLFSNRYLCQLQISLVVQQVWREGVGGGPRKEGF